MRFSNVAIEMFAGELPPEVWSSEDVERKLAPLYERLRLPQGRLELMTGIRERRFWPSRVRPSHASALAGRKALDRAGLGPQDIDLLVHAAVCRDRLEPSTAAYVHGELGLGGHTQIFDVSNACLGFLNAMIVGAGLIEAGQIRRALVVSGEDGRPLVERTLERLLDGTLDRNGIKPFFANLTIGAGAVAAVLCHRSLARPGALKLAAAITETDSAANKLCEGEAAGGALEMQTDSEQLLVMGVALATRTWARFKGETGWSEATPDRVICHQVGRQHQRKLFEALQLDLAKDYTTFERLGNIGSVSVPVTLALALEERAVKPGDKVALLGIGSGLSCCMMAVEV